MQLVWCPLVIGACVVVAKPDAALDSQYVQQLMLQDLVTFGGPARQQFRQKGEPSKFRQFFQLKIEKSDVYPKMTALVKL